MAITCEINGIEYKLQENFTINEQTSNKTSTTITVLVEDQPIPKARDTVEILRDGSRLYLGQTGIPKSPSYDSIYTQKLYTLTCGNANSILSNRIVNKAYQDTLLSDIVNDLYTTYISEEGFTLGTISTIDITFDVYTANDLNLQGVLDELATYANASWGIDNSNNFYFVVEGEFPIFGQDFDITYMPIQSGLQSEAKTETQRTVQVIKGAREKTDLQTSSFTYVTDENIFPVDFGVVEEPQIEVNSVSIPSANIGIKGIDSNDNNIAFLWSYGSELIDYNSSNTYITLIAGDTVDITYVGEYQIRIQVNNNPKIAELALQTGTSGKIDNVVIDRTLESINDANILADSLLSTHEDERREVTMTLNETKLAEYGYTLDDYSLLTAVNINLPQFDIVGKFVIVERNINIQNEFNINMTIKLVDRNYIKSYGQVLKEYDKSQNLSVREDEIILDRIDHTDVMALNGSTVLETDIPYYPTESFDTTLNGFTFYPDLANDVFPMYYG